MPTKATALDFEHKFNIKWAHMPADKELQTKLDIANNALLDSEILLSTANDELVC